LSERSERKDAVAEGSGDGVVDVPYPLLLASLFRSRRLVLYYYLGDHVLYLTYKIARRDLFHWTPTEGAASVLIAIVVRVVIKAITDFTGVAQFRGAAELGGAAWAFSQGMALVASLVATRIFLGSDGGLISESVVWTIVGGLSTGFIISFTTFLMLMKPGFWGTFVSIQTGCQYVQGKFLHEGDENKKAVFKYVQAERARGRGREPYLGLTRALRGVRALDVLVHCASAGEGST
jgi:hypothetical protein